MNHTHKILFASCLAAAGALLACARESSDAVKGGTNAQAVDSNKEYAIWVLANASCDHAALCDEIGSEKAYGTRHECVDHERTQSYDKACVEAVGESLRKCADQIRAGKCTQRGY